MRHFLISALLLSLVSGCSSVNLGPHRIDVQQGNALDQENVARLKPGLNRSQVRFLLGTPLVVDPFRTDRWDYVYVFYKAGKLSEQKRISLFFDGETLARIEGDLPPVAPAVPPTVATPKPEATHAAVEATPLPARLTPKAEAIPVVQPTPQQPAQSASAEVSPKPVASLTQPVQSTAVTSSIVPPLPSPKNAPAYIDPHTPAALSLQSETNVEQVKPDVIPSFPGTSKGADKGADKGDESIFKALNTWVGAWMRRDEAAYFAAYDASFVPPGGDSRADWEKRRHLLFGVAKNIDIKIDSPSVDRTEEGAATLTFNQYYRSDSYRDAVVKQLLMVERDGRWLIVEEKVLSTLSGAKR